jgi:predicted DNA-binding transcriptional regulator YafY
VDPAVKAAALLATAAEPPVAPKPRRPAPAPDTYEIVAERAHGLSAAEVEMLVEAIDDALPIAIDYRSGVGNATTRVIEPIMLDPPFVVAWCRLRDDERNFMIDRIAAVRPA